MHVFPYSPRAGTAAAAMDHQIDPRVKKERTSEAMALSAKLADAFRKEYVGREAVVITEENEDGCTKGYTSEYIPVKIRGILPHGEAVAIRMSDYTDHMMYGDVLNYETDGTV